MLSYVLPETTLFARREQRRRWWRRNRFGRAALLGVYIAVIVSFLPVVPDRTWYIGHHPQWIIAIDGAGLTLGPNYSAVTVLGRVPLAIVELVLVAAPVWVVERVLIRRRRSATR